jgi:hypothetical protein
VPPAHGERGHHRRGGIAPGRVRGIAPALHDDDRHARRIPVQDRIRRRLADHREIVTDAGRGQVHAQRQPDPPPGRAAGAHEHHRVPGMEPEQDRDRGDELAGVPHPERRRVGGVEGYRRCGHGGSVRPRTVGPEIATISVVDSGSPAGPDPLGGLEIPAWG